MVSLQLFIMKPSPRNYPGAIRDTWPMATCVPSYYTGYIPEEVAHAFILQRHIIGFLQSRQYWNKAAPTSFRGRRFVTFRDACTTSSGYILYHLPF